MILYHWLLGLQLLLGCQLLFHQSFSSATSHAINELQTTDFKTNYRKPPEYVRGAEGRFIRTKFHRQFFLATENFEKFLIDFSKNENR